MTPDNRDTRRAEIEEAAYRLLSEKGYKATSMLAVARAAKASNETLYNWYGNKQALFQAIVARNAAQARDTLQAALAGQGALDEVLDRLGPLLLRLVTGDKAVALNRAAAGDVHDTATLGPAIAAAGRDAIVPLLARLIARDAPDLDDAHEAAEAYIDLLIGDLQVRRVIGTMPLLSDTEIAARSDRARRLLARLVAPRRVKSG